MSGTAAGITFRANADATQHYTANVDTSGVVKLWRPGLVVATHATPIALGRSYRLEVVAAGSSIRVFLDGAQVINAVDTAYASGRFGVNVFSGTAEHQNATIDTGGPCTTVTGRWTPAGGVWTTPPGRRRGTATGDGFHLSDQTAADLTLAADVRVIAGAAAGLTFRANADATAHYTANVDTAGLVKLWRPGLDIAVAPAPIRAGRTYHLKVVATGPSIRVFLDGAQVIDAVDGTYASGRLGLNAFAGSAEFANVASSDFCAAFPGPWTGVGGTWADGPGGKRGTAVGDAFALSTRTASTVTYSGDVRLVSGTAAALTFRANATATQHYTATLDSSGVVKLWRPGHVIATHATTVTHGRTYRLTVLAEGSRIRVHLNGTPVIDAVDTTYPSGLLGVNVFDGTAEFQGLTAFDSVRD
ncbi:family 16 glycoside hydrolase [Actinokineospora soli]|uniref:Family 16 glycoside hydrolase n=1 Tax=Actinokineospora soli TaxID=1048753 RepID=A0ABW2TMX0_9PSEU